MICFSISAPFPWGARGRSGYCSQGKRLHSGRDPKDSQGGTGKAEEGKKGELKAGEFADFIVLSDDLTKIPAAQYTKTKVLLTVVGGRTVYSAAQ
jgi:hypothetical protein